MFWEYRVPELIKVPPLQNAGKTECYKSLDSCLIAGEATIVFVYPKEMICRLILADEKT